MSYVLLGWAWKALYFCEDTMKRITDFLNHPLHSMLITVFGAGVCVTIAVTSILAGNWVGWGIATAACLWQGYQTGKATEKFKDVNAQTAIHYVVSTAAELGHPRHETMQALVRVAKSDLARLKGSPLTLEVLDPDQQGDQ